MSVRFCATLPPKNGTTKAVDMCFIPRICFIMCFIPRIYASFFSATHGFSAGLFQYMLMEISLPLSLPIPKALPKSVSPDEKQLRKQLKGTKWPGRVLSPCRPCLSEKGPSLLTSINPPNCVVGGSSWGILVDLFDVQSFCVI